MRRWRACVVGVVDTVTPLQPSDPGVPAVRKRIFRSHHGEWVPSLICALRLLAVLGSS
jgi:hypothetical protein